MEKESSTEIVRTDSSNENDYLKFKLEKPVVYQQIHIVELDLSGIRDMTADDLEDVYDIYTNMGGGVIGQETTLRFAKIVASRVTGLPLEAIGRLGAKDAVHLKNRVQRFFYT